MSPSLAVPHPVRLAWPAGARAQLAGLALAVLAAHLALLHRAPAMWVPPAATLPHSPVRLLTRSLPATVPVAPAAVAPAPAAPASPTPPATRMAPAARPPAPEPSAAPSTTAPADGPAPEAGPAPQASAGPAEPATPAASAPAATPTPAPAADLASAPPPSPAGHDPAEADLAALAAVTVPGPVTLQYAVKGQAKGFAYSAHAELQWKPTATQYDARLEVNVFLLGSRVQTSSGRLTPQGLAPTRFSDKSRNEQATHFQRDKGKISFSANTPDAALLPGAQDRLSVLLQLSALLAGDPGRYPAGKTIGIQTAGPREAEVWRFTVAGEEGLNLPYGTLQGLKLVRPPRHEFDQKVELWFAPALNFLPIRIKLTQVRGDFVDQLLEGVHTP